MKRAKGAKLVTRAEEYRRYARQCLEIAPTFQDEEARATLLGFAQTWLRLAHLALANRHIAELTVQIRRQRVVVKHALDAGQRSEMAESLLDALKGSLRIFEKHRIFLLSCSINRPNKGNRPTAPTRHGHATGRDLSSAPGWSAGIAISAPTRAGTRTGRPGLATTHPPLPNAP
jgi:hypothetical protein